MKTEWEIGTDLRFFDNDLIFSLPTTATKLKTFVECKFISSSGFSTQYGNFAQWRTKDMKLTWLECIQTADLSLNASLNWASVNEVTDLYGTDVVNMFLDNRYSQSLEL